MNTNDLTAVILCGGKGERLRPLTETIPKALVQLKGKPLLYHLIRYLLTQNVSRFILCTGYKANMIEAFVESHCDPSWNIACVNSGDANMADRILDARDHLRGPFLICYGDTLANIDVVGLQEEHKSNRTMATLTVYPLHSPFGIVYWNAEKHITQFVEKPPLPYWINIGFLLCELTALDFLRRGTDLEAFVTALAHGKHVSVYQHSGKHLTVNTPKELLEAEVQVMDFYTVLENHS